MDKKLTNKEIDLAVEAARKASERNPEMEKAMPLIELTMATITNKTQFEVSLLIVSLLPLVGISHLMSLKETIEALAPQMFKREIFSMLSNGDIDFKDFENFKKKMDEKLDKDTEDEEDI